MNNEDNIEKCIIEMAKQQFVENGFDKTSMSDIAAILGINRPTLHYYFRTKEKLFQAVFGGIVSNILPHIQAIFNLDVPFFERLERVVDIYLKVFSENPMIPRFVINEIHRDLPHLIDSMRELSFDIYIQQIEEVICTEMNQGNIKRVPLPLIFFTFYSQLAFPFLAKPLAMNLFSQDEDEFKDFLVIWKGNLLTQMQRLLEISTK